MGRTLHYFIPKETKVTASEFREIDRVQQEYNRRFTWTCERLTLEKISWHPNWQRWEPDSGEPRTESNEQIYRAIREKLDQGVSLETLELEKYVVLEHGGYLGNEVSASGFTKVTGNEWNAFLVVHFLTWASATFPRLQIHVGDEGDFIVPHRVILQAGKSRLDFRKISTTLHWYEEEGLDAELRQLKRAACEARRGIFYAKVKAAEYLDCPEFQGVKLPRNEMERMTLSALSAYIDFPGKSDHASKRRS